MDLNSINSGTTDAKGWLNPVVGALKARSVGADSFQITDADSQDTVQLSGGIYRRASGFSPSFNVVAISYPFGAGMVDIANTQVSEGDVPISALVAGSSYELYFAGRFVDLSPGGNGAITFYPCFRSTQPTDFPDTMFELTVDGSATGNIQGFEARAIFRIISTTDTTIQFEASTISVMNKDAIPATVRQFTNTVVLSTNTPSRAGSNRFPFTIWAKSDNGPHTLTRTQLYLRRLS